MLPVYRSFWLFFQAMKGEKGIPGVSVGDNLGEELTDDSFSKNSGFQTFIFSRLVDWSQF